MIPLTEIELARAEAAIPAPKNKRPPLTPGRIVYLTWHYPRHICEDGLSWHWHLWKGRRDLGRALAALSPPPAPAGAPIPLHFLTGARYVDLTSISLLSAQHHFGRPVQPVLHDDGSLGESQCAAFRRLFPNAIIHLRPELEHHLEATLPESRYPFLRRIRLGYFHLRKLTDLQCMPGRDWRIVLDSDIFFFRHPGQLLALHEKPVWFHMIDCIPSYGAPLDTLSELAGAPVHPRVNVGICHIHQPSVDWDHVEHCARVLLARHGFSYYCEQALTAILMGRHRAQPLDEADYLVYPSREQAASPSQIALHYVDRSHLSMMRTGWRQVLNTVNIRSNDKHSGNS